MDELTADRWATLREQRPSHDDLYEFAFPDSEDLLIGVTQDGRLHLLVTVEIAPPNLPPELPSVRVRVLEHGRIWLDVSARSHHEDVFTLLANKVITAVRVQRRDPATAIEAILSEMRALFRPVLPELSTSEQIGLFGELWVMSNVLFPTVGPRVARLWSGPDGERHDFVGQGVHVEVKTTTRAEPRHEISRLDQLRAPAGKRLLFVSVMLERSFGGEETIADLIDELREKLVLDTFALDVFDGQLSKFGWREELRQTGSLLRFTFREVHVFEVAGDFPRLPDDYVAPAGVVGIRYVVDVGQVPALGVEEARSALACC
jgi:hypothetical protein